MVYSAVKDPNDSNPPAGADTGSGGFEHRNKQGDATGDQYSGDARLALSHIFVNATPGDVHAASQAGRDTSAGNVPNVDLIGKDGIDLPGRHGHKIHLSKDGDKIELQNGDSKVELQRNGKGESYTDGKGDSMSVGPDGKLHVELKNHESFDITQSEVVQHLGGEHGGIDIRYQRSANGLQPEGEGPLGTKLDSNGQTKVWAHTEDGWHVHAKQDGTYKVKDGDGNVTVYSYQPGADGQPGKWQQTVNGETSDVQNTSLNNGKIQLGADGNIQVRVKGQDGKERLVDMHAESGLATANVHKGGEGSEVAAHVAATDTHTTTTTGANGQPESAVRVNNNSTDTGPAVVAASSDKPQAGAPDAPNADLASRLQAAQSGNRQSGDFVLNTTPAPDGTFATTAQMGPSDQGATFNLSCDQGNGGYDYQGGNFWGDVSSTDPWGDLSGTTFGNDLSWTYDASTDTSLSGSFGGDPSYAGGYDTTGTTYDVYNDLSYGNTDLSFADVPTVDPDVAIDDADKALVNYQQAESELANMRSHLRPELAARVDAIISWIHTKEEQAQEAAKRAHDRKDGVPREMRRAEGDFANTAA